jgi:tRNA G10  N-methylase Trm11
MNKYIFLLGKASDLCFEELKVVLGQFNLSPERISEKYAISQIGDSSPDSLINLLGGTVKIAQILAQNPIDEVDPIISDLILTTSKPNFSIFGMPSNTSDQIKSSLKDKGKPSRFVHLEDIYASAISQQKNYHEYWKINLDKNIFIVKAIAFQNISDWSKRDYDRPRIDPKSGMLPPKIARILVNLAVPLKPSATIYDPFCGSGTILAEAMMLGHDCIGSDISQKAIDDSQKNLKWIKDTFRLDSSFKLFIKEVAHVTQNDLGSDIEAIIFEPYMGPSKIQQNKINNLVKGLGKLYLGAVKNCSKLQSRGNKLVLILPEFRFRNFLKTTDNLIDSCENFGYTRQAGPLIYDRPNSVVVRRIYILIKN